MSRNILWLLVSLWIPVSSLFAAADMSLEAIKKRIEPVGKVYIESTQPAEKTNEGNKTTTAVSPTASQSPVDGKVVYASNCKLCHETGVAGAPKLGDVAAWKPRIAKGMKTLVLNVINGYKAMPPKGSCIKCTDADIEAAVKYMIDASQ